MSDRCDSLACEAAAHERAIAAEAEVERLRGLLWALRDKIKFEANSPGGLVAEIDSSLGEIGGEG